MRGWFLALIIAVGLAAEPAGAQAPAELTIKPAGGERRVALVIGNAAYQTGGALANPVNDARAMSAKLKKVGFEVITVENGTQQSMRRAVSQFSNRLGPDAIALFYYAGHGMQVNGRNYLIPIDAEISTAQTVMVETIDVDTVINQMSMAQSRVNLVILDACRNNPYERRFRSTAGGLASIDAPTGTLIAYATSPGKVAADGTGDNGLYTAELLVAIDTPGAKVEDVFKRVRGNVVAKSRGDQTPWESSSLTGDFYFTGPTTVIVSPAAVPAPTAAGAPADRDALYWSSVKDSRNPALIQSYIDDFPQGAFVRLAKAMLDDLAKTQVAAAPARSDVAPVPAPAEAGPEIEELEGAWITTKRANLREKPVAEGKLVKALDPGVPVTVTGKVKGSQWFRVATTDGKLRGFVFGDAIKDVREAEAEEWGRVKDAKQSAMVTAFLRRYPTGAYAEPAKALRDALARAEVAPAVAPAAATPADPPPSGSPPQPSSVQAALASPAAKDLFALPAAQAPTPLRVGARINYRLTEGLNRPVDTTFVVSSVSGDVMALTQDTGSVRSLQTRSIAPFGLPYNIDTTFRTQPSTELRTLYPFAPGKRLTFNTVVNGATFETKCTVGAGLSVSVPAGTYQAIPISCFYESVNGRMIMNSYFAPDINLGVKIEFQAGTIQSLLELTSFAPPR